MNTYCSILKKLVDVFLQEEDNYPELFEATDQLYKLFIETSGIELESDTSREDIYLSSGKAIGPTWAAMCVKELMRTKQFLRGIHKAIKTAQSNFPGETIHILYAGTGPFATLAIPFTTLFTSQEICFTCLEINPESVRLLEKVITQFNAEAFIEDIVQCDAALYQHNQSRPIHILITETMLNALQKEPQVSITMNLVPQIRPNGILIPQNISIEAVMLSQKKNLLRMTASDDYNGTCWHRIKSIFELNKETAVEYADKFPVVDVVLPKHLDLDYNELCLFTTIRIFDDVYLHSWQCSLNLPQKILNLNSENNSINSISFQYVANENSKFHYDTI